MEWIFECPVVSVMINDHDKIFRTYLRTHHCQIDIARSFHLWWASESWIHWYIQVVVEKSNCANAVTWIQSHCQSLSEDSLHWVIGCMSLGHCPQSWWYIHWKRKSCHHLYWCDPPRVCESTLGLCMCCPIACNIHYVTQCNGLIRFSTLWRTFEVTDHILSHIHNAIKLWQSSIMCTQDIPLQQIQASQWFWHRFMLLAWRFSSSTTIWRGNELVNLLIGSTIIVALTFWHSSTMAPLIISQGCLSRDMSGLCNFL